MRSANWCFTILLKNGCTAEVEQMYPECSFYLGLLKGHYSMDKEEIALGKDTTVTVFSNKQYYPKDGKLSAKEIKKGSSIRIGKTRAKVLASKDGELVLTTEQ